MALIIEDGSIVVGANSYVSATEAIEYATLRGETFPTGEADVEALLIKAMDYLETYRSLFTGQKVSKTQELQYPRIDSTVDGDSFPDDAIPKELKKAQCELAISAYDVGDLMPTTTGYAVAKEKIDVIEVEYAAGGRLSGNSPPAKPEFPKVEALLDALISGSAGAWLTVVRV